MPSDVGLVAQAIAKIAEVVANWQISRDRRRMEAAIEAAEKYIMTNTDKGIAEERRLKLLTHYSRKFFSLN